LYGACGARIFAALAFTCSLLAKQNFLPLLTLLLVFAVFERKRRVSLVLATVLPPAAVLGGVVLVLGRNHALSDFVFQIAMKSKLSDVFSVTCEYYLRPFPQNVLMVCVGMLLGAPRWISERFPRLALVVLAAPWVVLGSLAVVLSVYQQAVTGTLVFWLIAGLVAPTLLRACNGEKVDETLLAYEVFVLVSAWASSISWTWITCLFSVAPLAWIIFSRLKDFRLTLSQRRLSTAMAMGAVLVTAIFVQRAQETAWGPRREMVHDIGRLFPKIGTLYASAEDYAYLAELKEISDELRRDGDRPVVLAEVFSLFFFETDRQSPISFDWLAGWGRESGGFEPRLQAEIIRANPQIIAYCKAPRFPSPIRKWMAANWELVVKGRMFCVFRLNPRLYAGVRPREFRR
ncbi:MAG: hypothetical protein HY074_13200, partial [Deltaproteobacteria bacterium]|nr:hypothetical protein [Deltaproteobacteria bacterium]